MRRVSITLSDELEVALEAWLACQSAAPSRTAVLQAALEEFLSLRGFAVSPRKLRTTPSIRGSGTSDVSVAHDRYLAEG